MRVTERKEVVKTTYEDVIVCRKCDVCSKPIEPIDANENYHYFVVTTHHHDWGNDSIESYEHYDACCPECALKIAENYLHNAYKTPYNSRTIEIEHCRSLHDGSDRGRPLTALELTKLD